MKDSKYILLKYIFIENILRYLIYIKNILDNKHIFLYDISPHLLKLFFLIDFYFIDYD